MDETYQFDDVEIDVRRWGFAFDASPDTTAPIPNA